MKYVYIKLPIEEVLQITRLITLQNYFKFHDKTYLQIYGLAMRNPNSTISPPFYLQHLEKTKIFDILCSSEVVGYFKYVDDILIVYNENNTVIEEVQKAFNNNTEFNFTQDRETDYKLNFLDSTIAL